MTPPSVLRPHRGTVTAFDEARGLGLVTTDEGVELAFQATVLADGTRTVAVGTAVVCLAAAGAGGRYEARAVTAR